MEISEKDKSNFEEMFFRKRFLEKYLKKKGVGNLRKKKVDFSNCFFRKSGGFRRLIF